MFVEVHYSQNKVAGVVLIGRMFVMIYSVMVEIVGTVIYSYLRYLPD